MLTSVKNPRVAAAVKLKKHAFREADRRFLVEGAQGVGEALADPGWLESLFVVDDLDPVAIACARGRRRGPCGHRRGDGPAHLHRHASGAGRRGPVPAFGLWRHCRADGCVPILHEVRDPGNAGTVLRSADASGARGMVFTSSSVDVYNPKTVRASAGSHLPPAGGPRRRRRRMPCAATRDRGFRILAMDADGAKDLYATDLSGPGRVRVRERGARAARRGHRGPGRRHGPRSARRAAPSR